jgi:hypothetical protein
MLKDQASGSPVPAAIDDLLALESLFNAEEQWCVARVRVLRDLSAVQASRSDWPQSVHWSWAYKAATLAPSRLDALGDVRLFGIEAVNQWQGLLFALSEGHFTRLGTSGRPLVYVDFLESAPWNWNVQATNQVGRFSGIGLQLMELASRWSLSLDYGGRIGLHALPQSEGFYKDRREMNNLGMDAKYHDLCYFELTEPASAEFLRRNA